MHKAKYDLRNPLTNCPSLEFYNPQQLQHPGIQITPPGKKFQCFACFDFTLVINNQTLSCVDCAASIICRKCGKNSHLTFCCPDIKPEEWICEPHPNFIKYMEARKSKIFIVNE